MLFATLLALGAAVLHAGWNLVAKRSKGDIYMTLWAQFFMGAVFSLPLMIGYEIIWGMPWQGYMWAAVSGCIHLPYVWLLARAYTVGDFSVSYPVARGGGAAIAAICGVVFLRDHLTTFEIVGICVVVCGLALLAYGATGVHLATALLLACAIGLYTTSDAKGARTTDSVAYVFASSIGTMSSNTIFALATGRRREMVAVLRSNWRMSTITGLASLVTYGMVLVAVRHAPVGYVTALRESSVVLAALAGWKLLGEGDHRRRLTAAFVVFCGLLTLVLGR
ncbi:MAG: EamA family transporter [Actinomycetota bacterium]|nr:EamA family transporter [Actinomycetota bacterium]